MALIDNLSRSASVVAKEPTETLSLDHRDFHKQIEKNPAGSFRITDGIKSACSSIAENHYEQPGRDSPYLHEL